MHPVNWMCRGSYFSEIRLPQKDKWLKKILQATAIKVNNDNGSRCEEQGCFVTSSPCTGF